MAHFSSPIAAATPSRRRWVRRVVIGLNVTLGTVLVVSLVALGYAVFVYGKIDKLSLGLSGRGTSSPMNILIVGSDSRDGLSKAEKKSYGPDIGQRSDTIMLAHLDPNKKSVTMVSFPRDLWVDIAGTSGKERINTAYSGSKSATTGAKTLIQTVEQDFDVKIDHYVEVDFNGFQSTVDAIGGVYLNFSTPVRDSESGFSVANPGCRHMLGKDALAYSRSRHYEWKSNGVWHDDPQSDISRIQRQQNFIKDVASRSIQQAGGSALTTERLVRKGIGFVKLDDSFGIGDLVSLAKRYRSVDPNTMQLLGPIPASGANIGGASVLKPDYDAANALLAPFRSGGGNAPSNLKTSSSAGSGVAAFKPSEVKVKVSNGSGINGQASDVATQLKSYGFSTAGFGEADKVGYTKSVINYAPGQEAKAKFLQTYIKGDSVLQQQTSLSGVDVELITGSSFGGLVTTTTTAKTTTSSSIASTSSTTASSSSSSSGSAPTTGAASDVTTSGAPIPQPCNPT